MGTNNSSKKIWEKSTTFVVNIKNTVFLTVIVAIFSAGASFLMQVFYEPPWVKTIIEKNASLLSQSEKIAQYIGRLEKPDSLLILYGGGTVQEYLRTKKSIESNANLLIIPTPTTDACNRLGDDVFVSNFMGRVIIMSSKKAEEKDFLVNNQTRSNECDNILEIFLATDTFYIHTDKKEIYNQYKKGIKSSQLIDLLKESSTNSTKIYLTSRQSGTWSEYSKMTNKYVDSIPLIKEYSIHPDCEYIENDYIILARANYDPIKEKKRNNHKIFVLNDDGSKKVDSIFFYIPVKFDKGTIIEHSIINNFLNQIKIFLEYSNIKKPNRDGPVIIRSDESHRKVSK